jgi:hypothetical protein
MASDLALRWRSYEATGNVNTIRPGLDCVAKTNLKNRDVVYNFQISALNTIGSRALTLER